MQSAKRGEIWERGSRDLLEAGKKNAKNTALPEDALSPQEKRGKGGGTEIGDRTGENLKKKGNQATGRYNGVKRGSKGFKGEQKLKNRQLKLYTPEKTTFSEREREAIVKTWRGELLYGKWMGKTTGTGRKKWEIGLPNILD